MISGIRGILTSINPCFLYWYQELPLDFPHGEPTAHRGFVMLHSVAVSDYCFLTAGVQTHQIEFSPEDIAIRCMKAAAYGFLLFPRSNFCLWFVKFGFHSQS